MARYALRRLDWVICAKPPSGGPKQVLAYLGRYTHHVAIANRRLLAFDERTVRLSPAAGFARHLCRSGVPGRARCPRAHLPRLRRLSRVRRRRAARRQCAAFDPPVSLRHIMSPIQRPSSSINIVCGRSSRRYGLCRALARFEALPQQRCSGSSSPRAPPHRTQCPIDTPQTMSSAASRALRRQRRWHFHHSPQPTRDFA
jgi:hypothetical protein